MLGELVMRAYGALLRRLKPNAGLTRLAFNPVTKRLMRGVTGTRPAVMTDGTVIEVDPNDYHGRILWLFGSNDFKVSRAVNALLSPGDDVLDIGANYSTIGLAARHCVAPGGHIHLFEPQPHLVEVVRTAIQRAGIGDQVTLHPIALFSENKTMTLRVPGFHSGRATLMEHGLEPDFEQAIEVPVHETASYVGPLVDGRRFGVKIDVEGAELEILPGLVAQPGMRFCVFEGAHDVADLLSFFNEHGFDVFGLKRQIFTLGIAPVNDAATMGRFHDFLAVRRAALAEDADLAGRVARLAAA